MTSSLRELQRLWWTLTVAPDGVAAGLRQIDKKPEELERVLRGDGRLSAVERLDIYANMYFFRLYDVLQQDYPALRACVGEADFYRLCTDYLAACPSQHPSVRNVGERLAAYLPGHALGRERPWLAELAALERTRLEVFDGPDAEPLTVDDLRAQPPEAFVRLALPLIPSHAWVRAAHRVDEVWSAVAGDDAPTDDDHDHHRDESHGGATHDQHEGHDHATAREAPSSPTPPAAEPRALLVWRQDIDVYHRPLPPLEAEALARAETGACFGELCDLIAERMPVAEAGPAAFQMLATWVQDGLIARR